MLYFTVQQSCFRLRSLFQMLLSYVNMTARVPYWIIIFPKHNDRYQQMYRTDKEMYKLLFCERKLPYRTNNTHFAHIWCMTICGIQNNLFLLNKWLGGVTVRASDLRLSSHGFDSRSGRCQAAKVNSAFHPSGVDKSGIGLASWG